MKYFECREVYHYLSSPEMQKTLKHSWDNKRIIIRSFPSVIENEIVHFSNQCLKLYKNEQVYQYWIDMEFGTPVNTDLFYQEKLFLLAVFCWYGSTYERRLRKVAEEYPPAKELLTGKHPYSYKEISNNSEGYLKWFITEYLTTRVSK